MKRSTPTGGSQPEEQYVPATREKMFLDRPTSHGGWPEGEYDPPVRDRIYGWYKKMKMMPESDADAAADEYIDDHKGKTMKITESHLRRIIRQEILREAVPYTVNWEEGLMGKMHFGTPAGEYTWEPSTGYLTHYSKGDGRLTVLSHETSPRRDADGFHNATDDRVATALVLNHMRLSRSHKRKAP